jgi:hypothetical protein
LVDENSTTDAKDKKIKELEDENNRLKYRIKHLT